MKLDLGNIIRIRGLKCHWCGHECNWSLSPSADLYPTREHLIRRADGGKTVLGNLVIACRKCNNERQEQTEYPFRKSRKPPVAPAPNKNPSFPELEAVLA